jgi:hypothetical protein
MSLVVGSDLGSFSMVLSLAAWVIEVFDFFVTSALLVCFAGDGVFSFADSKDTGDSWPVM